MSDAVALSVLAAAREAPEATAVVAPDRSWSFAALAEEARAVMTLLDDADARVGARHARVALTCRVDTATLARVAALFEASRTAVLLHARWTPRERQAALRLAGPVLDLDAAPVQAAAGAPAPDALGLLVPFTSGTDAAPRAVVLSRAAVLAAARAAWEHLGSSPGDRWLLALPTAHVGGLSVFTRCLVARRPVVLLPAFEPRAFARAVTELGVTIASLVPAMLDRVLDELPGWTPPPSLRAVLVGGAPAPRRLREAARRRRVPVLPTYGLTETCAQVATVEPGSPPDAAAGCGRPLQGVEVRAREGVLEVRGATLFDGYLENGALRPAPLVDGWFATGDRGRVDAAGRLHVEGRAGDLIVTGGENVSPREVEEQLEAFPGIERALAFGVEDPRFGRRVAAALVASRDGPPDETRLARHLEATLAPFKRPRSVAFVDALPSTPAGKPDRRGAATALETKLRPLRDGGR